MDVWKEGRIQMRGRKRLMTERTGELVDKGWRDRGKE
jgi:hypothetical protein